MHSLTILPLTNHGAECFLNTALNMFRLGNSYTSQIFKDKIKIEKIIEKTKRDEISKIKSKYDELFILFIKSHDIENFYTKITRLLSSDDINTSKKKYKSTALFPLYVSFYGMISFFQLCDFILHDVIPNKQLLYGLLVLKKMRIVENETQLSWCAGIPCDCSRVILAEMLTLMCNYYDFYVDPSSTLMKQTTFIFEGEILPSIPIEIFDDKTTSLKKGIFSLIKICMENERTLLPFDKVKTLFFYNNVQFGENELPILLHFKGDKKIHTFSISGIGVASSYDVASFNASHHFSLGVEKINEKKIKIMVGNDGHFSTFDLDIFTTFTKKDDETHPSIFSYDMIRKYMKTAGSFPSIVVYNKVE